MKSKQGILFRMSDQYRSLKNVVYVNGHMIHFYNGFNNFSALLYKEISTDAANSSFKVLFYAVDLCLPLDFTYVFQATFQATSLFTWESDLIGMRFFISNQCDWLPDTQNRGI